ncbi:hypothetical protein KUC_2029 [Vreelandella boliviensis LC1]|uniref:Uncharacterized protein n=1 Tax=Vreelandella boliviensis LC1 TaxID=1072583 RepID=A0A7U9GFC6_9GAMM|nr:hypothetical protein KUC_2029 [Halomonas boliviensis LC1]
MSRHFQDTFAAHTQEVFQNQVVCCVSGDIKEVLIPSCDRYLKCVEFFPMPDKKTEYLQRGGLL